MTKKEVRKMIEKGLEIAKKTEFLFAEKHITRVGVLLERKNFVGASRQLINSNSDVILIVDVVMPKLKRHIADGLKKVNPKALDEFLATFYVRGHSKRVA